MNLNYTAIGAWTAVFAACVAVVALWIQERRNRFAHGIDILFKLSDEFNSEAFRQATTELAQLIVEKSCRSLDEETQERFNALATDLLNHFETLGFLSRRGILDKEMIYVYYFYRIHGFWRCLQDVINENRPDYPLLWNDAEWLHGQLVSIARKQQPAEYVDLTDAYVTKFVEYMAHERPVSPSATARI